MTTGAQVLRTTPDDDLFVRMDRALGVPVINQIVWRLRTAPSAEELDRLAAALRRGALDRLLRRSRVPLARDRWTPAGGRSGRHLADPLPVPDDGLAAWMDAAASTRFDLTDGPVWELRSAVRAEVGGVVSLCSAHAVGDGAQVVGAVEAALRSIRDDIAPTSYLSDHRPSPIEDLRDGVGQAAVIGRGLAALATDTLRERRTASGPDVPAAVTARTSRVVPPDPATTDSATGRPAPMCVMSLPTVEWNAAATKAGGTGNALFMAMVVGILVAAGRATWTDTVRISIPMSTRSTDDPRANASVGLALDLPASAVRQHDLATVRRLAKEVFTRGTDAPSSFVRLQPLMQALGDRTVLALNRHATTPLALASNLGSLGPQFSGLGDPARADAVVTRSTTQSVDVQRLRDLRGGVAAWIDDAGATTTVSVIGLDPDALGRDILPGMVRDEFARWSLRPQQW
ncbi:hypothetical protein [Williamsia sterculiae]|uniref:Condensation domain-containing protein n=1 Tax=Williamsia sterculiae TaxID=1344003 RepID=A0A1N7DZM2_9NOCA|nr:hypothetical protein [Williamsia sterculiae]SIR81274.1 hypothetical protein SAMN05445060_1043 [Williamsia sterculiae]